MGYYIDLERITIEDYKTRLGTAYLPPGRMILKERLDERFEYFRRHIGLNDVRIFVDAAKEIPLEIEY
jgi:hypothetical protein